MNTFFNDVKYGFRQLIKTPGFTVLAVVTLAVGIGVNAAVFSLINGWMLRPLPGGRDGKLVRLFCRSTEPEGKYRSFSYPYYAALREGNRSFVGLAAFSPRGLTLREQGITRMAIGAYVSSDFFDTFGIKPARGRFFTKDEERPGSRVPVGIISNRLWQQLGADPEIVGRSLTINDTPVTVVGILPASFVSASQVTNKEIWLPLGMIDGFSGQAQTGVPARLSTHAYRPLFLIGQLKPGLTVSSIASLLEPLTAGLASAHPLEYSDLKLSAGSVGNILMSHSPGQKIPISKPLTTLITVSGSILLIACLNLAHIFLARGMSRQREISIRLALGSSRFRIMRQLVTEGLLLSLAGGAVGMVLASWSIRIPVQAFEQWTIDGRIPTVLDWRLLFAGMGLCILSTLAFSWGPAWSLTKTRNMTHLREPMGRTLPTSSRWRKALIAAQVALAFVLVTCAGLFVQSARGAAQADPGFALNRGLLVELALKQQERETYPNILARLRSLPGVQAVSMGSTIPYLAFSRGLYRRAGNSVDGKEGAIEAKNNTISAAYFKSLDVPLLRGREFTFTEEQSDQGPRVVLIDEILAQRLWPDENPIGQYLQTDDNTSESLQIVGLVPHLRDNLIEAQANAQVYFPFGQHGDSHMFVYTQLNDPVTPASLRAMKKMIKTELLALNPVLPIKGIRTWQEQIDYCSFQSLTIKLGAQLFATLGILALGLAAVGLFGITSYWVSQRTREIGIRMALGATDKGIIWKVLRESLLLTLIGMSTGLLLTWICTRFLESLLFEVSGTDPAVLLITMIVLITTILLASLLPARRAARVDPMEALRYE